jgi:hypothetical protein
MLAQADADAWLKEALARALEANERWERTAAELRAENPPAYLTAYLDACGRNAGKPLQGPDLKRFLPWAAAPADLRAWSQPARPG